MLLRIATTYRPATDQLQSRSKRKPACTLPSARLGHDHHPSARRARAELHGQLRRLEPAHSRSPSRSRTPACPAPAPAAASAHPGGETELLVAAYECDGRNHRVVKESYEEGSLASVRHFYYSDRWQVLNSSSQYRRWSRAKTVGGSRGICVGAAFVFPRFHLEHPFHVERTCRCGLELCPTLLSLLDSPATTFLSALIRSYGYCTSR